MDKAVVQHCPGLISPWPANTADGYQACSLLAFFLFVGRELCTNKYTIIILLRHVMSVRDTVTWRSYYLIILVYNA